MEVMQQWPDQCIDLIYLDPPFNSKANYNQTFGKGNGVPAQVRAFTDTWIWNDAAAQRTRDLKNAVNHPAHKAIVGLHTILGDSGMLAYLTYMAERLAVMKNKLKDTGSIYLHCDPTASHYLKMVMDCVFGASSFRNEIIWCYAGGGVPKKDYPKKHDVIFRYAGKKRVFNVERRPYGNHAKNGQRATDLGGTRSVEYHPEGTPVNCWWDDIKPLINWHKEKLGYPTQKPLALLERIIKASSNEGDVVLDPFMGGGTTLEAAEKNNRKWIGIDVSPRAIDLVKNTRFNNPKIPAYGIPTDMESARMMLDSNPYDFEAWAVTRVAGLSPNEIKTGDGGIDGRGKILTPIEPEQGTDQKESGLVIAQVKGGGYSASALRDFLHVMEREKASAGIFITMKKTTTSSALAEAGKLGNYKIGASMYPKLQFWSIEEYLEGHTPKLPTMADPDTGKALQETLPMI